MTPKRTNVDALREQVDQLRAKVKELNQDLNELRQAAQNVIDSWSEGDLAGAVNELESLLPE